MADNDDYYDITSEIDAREVLRYLNDLGIRNISGEVLKYFITDLKKYILYDLRHKHAEDESKKSGPERLHSASTFSSRLRSKSQNGVPIICTRETHTNNINKLYRPTSSAPNLHQNIAEKPQRRACSCASAVRKESKENLQNNNKKPTQSSSNIIKVPISKPVKKCDPVTLYHYYISMWEKYKTNVPGENNWADLRWNIRQKMAGYGDINVKKVCTLSFLENFFPK